MRLHTNFIVLAQHLYLLFLNINKPGESDNHVKYYTLSIASGVSINIDYQ